MHLFRRLPLVALLGTGALSCGFGTSPAADTSPPVVVITSPTSSEVSGPVTFSAEVIDDTGVANVVFKVDDKTIAEDGLPPYETAWASKASGDGAHKLSVTGIDITGKFKTVSINVTVVSGPN
jgi:hypothetical protein